MKRATMTLCLASALGGLGCGSTTSSQTNDATEHIHLASKYPLSATWPEGGIYHEADEAFYVGSLGDGSVHRVDAVTGQDETIFTETAEGPWWTLGMAVDPSGDQLWVCAMKDLRGANQKPSYDGYVWVFDVATQERIAVIDLAEAFPEATCTDVTFAADGTAYVVDRDFGHVYSARLGEAPRLIAQDDELHAFIGQNAAVVLPDQSALLIAVYLHPRLVRVDLETGDVQRVDIDGGFSDWSSLLSGADGMTLHDGLAYVVFGSEVVQITPLNERWTHVRAKEKTVSAGVTDIVSTPDGLFLLNGQAVRFALGQKPKPFTLTRFTGTF